MERLPRINLTALPRSIKIIIVACSDMCLLALSLWGALALRVGDLTSHYVAQWPWIFIAVPLMGVMIFTVLGIYRTMVRYIAPGAIYQVAKGTLFTALGMALLVTLTYTVTVPRSLYFIFWLNATILLAGSRYAVRYHYGRLGSNMTAATPVLIYGAGDSGFHLATAMLGGIEYWPVGFIDDNPGLHGRVLHGIRVYPRHSVPKLVEEFEVEEIVVAIPSASPEERREVINFLIEHPVHVRTIPNMRDLVSGKARGDDLRDINVDDLLGRNPALPDETLLQHAISDHNIMVTGGGGSIGSELCRQIVRLNPRSLVIFELSEFALYSTCQELEKIIRDEKISTRLVRCLGSVQDEPHVLHTIRKNRIDVLFHAAAYKHVPIVEENVCEGVRNNVFGTLAVARSALKSGVKRFVLVSTDKAVRPTNVMGASKRVAELIVQAHAAMADSSIFCMVRFGNVLGSSGSVVPLFKKQIASGGPVTVTHPDITRYFMTIPEAAQLVIQAGAMAQGGEVFVLDMGNPVKIVDLARNMVRLAGKTLQDEKKWPGSIALEFTGLRPGEKLYEELLIGHKAFPTAHPSIMKAEEDGITPEQMDSFMNRMRESIAGRRTDEVCDLLNELVVGYNRALSSQQAAAELTEPAVN